MAIKKKKKKKSEVRLSKLAWHGIQKLLLFTSEAIANIQVRETSASFCFLCCLLLYSQSYVCYDKDASLWSRVPWYKSVISLGSVSSRFTLPRAACGPRCVNREDTCTS